MKKRNSSDFKRFHLALLGKKCPIHKVYEWVGNNLGRSLDDLASDEAPCFLAIHLLQWARPGMPGYDIFMQTLPKLLLDKKQLEQSDGFKDDSRPLLLLAQMEAELNANRAQRLRGEHDVPPVSAEAGPGKPVGAGRDQSGSSA